MRFGTKTCIIKERLRLIVEHDPLIVLQEEETGS